MMDDRVWARGGLPGYRCPSRALSVESVEVMLGRVMGWSCGMLGAPKQEVGPASSLT
jgi:hypothetical protein